MAPETATLWSLLKCAAVGILSRGIGFSATSFWGLDNVASWKETLVDGVRSAKVAILKSM
jgi:hypothetical protein